MGCDKEIREEKIVTDAQMLLNVMIQSDTIFYHTAFDLTIKIKSNTVL